MLSRVSNYRGTQPILGKLLLGTGILSGFLAGYSYFQSSSA
jgi:hypothetical protein